MATLTCRIVRPDKELFEGEATSVVLVTRTGEMGVLLGRLCRDHADDGHRAGRPCP
jgi:F0F1-type ATP synthase epsilon subunit